MAQRNNEKLLVELISKLELPESAYEKAIKRYEDVGEWIGREESLCVSNDPHIFPQGSFRLGTAIRPLNNGEEYDLDLACNLRTGISASSSSQKTLKELVGRELEQYRAAKSIKAPLDNKHRCWRLEYADDISFHMDIVPCIPKDETHRESLANIMEIHGMNKALAVSVSELAVGITDDRHPGFEAVNSSWLISNPEGYAKWFETRMQESQGMSPIFEAAQVDDVPVYRRKSPLQRAIQLLKRHRDQMFVNNSDSKPISVIITTLAAQSYSGTANIEVALREVLDGLNQFISSDSDCVPNPVNPDENFADRWHMPQYEHLQLKENFRNWSRNVTRDFNFILGTGDIDTLLENVSENLRISASRDGISKAIGMEALERASHVEVSPSPVSRPQSKPWFRED